MIKYFTTCIFIIMLAAAWLVPARSCALDSTIIPEDEVTTEWIVKTLRAADIKAWVDDDGDVQVNLRAEGFWIRCEIDKSRIYFMAYREFRESADLEQKFNLMNVINDELVIIRAAVTTKRNRLWLDFTFPTEAGITGEQLVNMTRRYASLLGSINRKDSDDILKLN